MVVEGCSFKTCRLSIDCWRGATLRGAPLPDRSQVVASILTQAVTRALPDGWQGHYDERRAEAWLAAREHEGPVLFAVEHETDAAVGLVLLFESETEDGRNVDVRLGYLFAEEAWGKGLASELVTGFVEWCRGEGLIRSVIAGVGIDNRASLRVLEKNGFRELPTDPNDPGAELVLVLDVRL